MAVVAHAFTHFDRTFKKGDKVNDDDPLVTGAPHLFVGFVAEPVAEPPLAEPQKTRKR